jgi:hypothetical protein
LFGDRVPKRDGASSSQILDDVVLHVPLAKELVMEPDYEIMDLVLSQENVALTKKIKKAYEMNKHFQDIWIIKLAWVKFVMGSNGKVVYVWCKVCSFSDGKDKLFSYQA